MPQEFFKWLGNFSEGDLKRLASHLLHRSPKHKHAHPKVTMKKVTSVIPDCYSAKEWMERCKRKQAVRKELHILNRSLGLYNVEGSFRHDKWKAFKTAYNVTKATKNLLLYGPGEEFFSLAKMPSNKNKPIAELSPYAAEFFRVFLESKGKFKKPEATTFYRPYDMENDKLAKWNAGDWEDSTSLRIGLAVMDFRIILGVINKQISSHDSPYFEDFLETVSGMSEPEAMDPKVWLWICGEKDVEVDLVQFIRVSKYGETYTLYPSEYVPEAMERLYDLPEKSNRAKEPIYLIFLIKKGKKIKPKKIPWRFEAPDLSRYSNPRICNSEIEYRLYDCELRMEFYLQVLDLFLSPRDTVVSIYAGGKIICAAWVCSADKLYQFHFIVDFLCSVVDLAENCKSTRFKMIS